MAAAPITKSIKTTITYTWPMIHAFLNHGRDMPSAGLPNQSMATAAQIMAIPIVVFMAVPLLLQGPRYSR